MSRLLPVRVHARIRSTGAFQLLLPRGRALLREVWVLRRSRVTPRLEYKASVNERPPWEVGSTSPLVRERRLRPAGVRPFRRRTSNTHSRAAARTRMRMVTQLQAPAH
ncbi:hypothetical protein FKP32DRAFT_220208 [Trametes sanguinea]|nr:hypothetical protein FKP32DRAFT_220208 [Trametes sanguinea]